MGSKIESIRELIIDYVEISQSEWEYCEEVFKLDNAGKKEVILFQGAVCRNVFFVVSGLLRIYFIDQRGQERTFHFSSEKTFAADYESFLKRTSSGFSIQALEETEFIAISFEMLQDLYKSLRYGEKLGRLIAEDYFFLVNDKVKALYGQTPLERYNAMNERFPKILQRVSQRYIASYLNISPVHLSRLKKLDKQDRKN